MADGNKSLHRLMRKLTKYRFHLANRIENEMTNSLDAERYRTKIVIQNLALLEIVVFCISIFLVGSRSRIEKAPGSIGEKILRFLFPRKAFDQVFAQAIADMRDEYIEALSEDRRWLMRWIVIRDHFGLLLAVVTYLTTTIGKKIVQVWKLGS